MIMVCVTKHTYLSSIYWTFCRNYATVRTNTVTTSEIELLN